MVLDHLVKGSTAKDGILLAEDVQKIITSPVVVSPSGLEIEDDPGYALEATHHHSLTSMSALRGTSPSTPSRVWRSISEKSYRPASAFCLV